MDVGGQTFSEINEVGAFYTSRVAYSKVITKEIYKRGEAAGGNRGGG